jgi:hypothetical protein
MREPPKRRWFRYQFSLRSTFIVIALVGIVAAGLAIILKEWRSLQLQTVSVRLKSSRSVSFGDTDHAMADALPDLRSSALLLKSHGFRVRLLIEYYNDVDNADLNDMLQLGRDADFDIVEAKNLTWASPLSERE